MMWKLGAAEDNARFIRERAQALSPEEGLTILEELRAMTYDDPEAPPRLARVFVLSRGPRGPAKRACGRPKALLDIELLREAGLLPAKPRVRRRPAKRRATRP